MELAKIILLIILIIVIIIIAIVLYYIYRQPICGSNVDPSQFQCSKNGKLIRIKTKRCRNEENNKQSNKLADIAHFLNYMKHLNQEQVKMTILTTDISWEQGQEPEEIIPGTFYFAIDSLLNLLPTDFGQNKQTPYGIMSFFYPSFSCLPDSFCSNLFRESGSPILIKGCQKYVSFQQTQYNQSCPFSLHSLDSSGLDIKDPNLYDQLGMLGALSIQTNDVMVLYSHIPVSSLDLNYWSISLYLADHVKPNETCYPFRQISACSLCPPLNMFNCLQYNPESWTEFNPFLVDSVHVFTIISLDKNLIERVKKALKQRHAGLSNLVIHGFEIPSMSGVPLQDNLPNPNTLTKDSVYFDEKYDRFVLFLRLSQFPDSDPSVLKKFIHQEDTIDFQTVLYRFPSSTTDIIERCPYLAFPNITSPFMDEIKEKSSDFHSFFQTIYSNITSFPEYHIINNSIICNNSILNIFAPLYKQIKSSNIPYENGFQAFQMAGNAQADNHDAQYRTSKVVCISPNDVFIAFCINHAYFHNCIYNNINLIDYSKALSIFATALDFSSPFPYYLVLVSRSSSLLDKVQSKLSSLPFPCKIIPYLIDEKMNFCHPFLFVERVYLNTYIQSSLNLFSLLGPTLQQSLPSISPDTLQTLSNICAPDNSTLLKPIYMHFSFNQPTFYYSGILALFILFFLLVFFIFLLKLHQN